MGVLITKRWDLEGQVPSLLLATASLMDSPSAESALEPPFLGCSRRGEEGEGRRSQSACKGGEAPGEVLRGRKHDIMGWRPWVWRGGTQEEKVGEGH